MPAIRPPDVDVDGETGRRSHHRFVFPEEFAIPHCDATRAIDPHHILVILSHLDDGASLVPPARVGAGLVLKTYQVTDDQGWELFGVCSPSLSVAHMTVA